VTRTGPHNGELQPIEPPLKPWDEITYDLITGLPESEGFDAVLTVVDWHPRMAHYIPIMLRATAVDMANLFVTHIWKLHGLPKCSISDRGTVFNSHFLKQLYKHLDVKLSFSTAYCPQTDSQSERSNQILEAYLHHYVSHCQNDWAALLPLAEFAYNNGVQVSTGRSLFFTCCGFHPRLTVSNEEDALGPAMENHVEFLRKGFKEVTSSLNLANEKIKEFYNQCHQGTRDFKVGDQVWLSHENITSDCPSRKLAHHCLGPYPIVAKDRSHAYKPTLPHSMKTHPVFHVLLLTSTKPDIYGWEPPRPPSIITPDKEGEFEVK
jgi:hypothetical protein